MNTTDTPLVPQPRVASNEETLKSIYKAHSQRIAEINQNALKQYQLYISQTKTAYRVTMMSYLVFVIVAIALITVSTIIVFRPGTTVFSMLLSAGFFIAGVILILILMGKNPLRVVRRSTMEMNNVNVVFTGFMHQLHQIDSCFLKILKATDDSGLEDIPAISESLQSAIEKSVDAFTLMMNDLEE